MCVFIKELGDSNHCLEILAFDDFHRFFHMISKPTFGNIVSLAFKIIGKLQK